MENTKTSIYTLTTSIKTIKDNEEKIKLSGDSFRGNYR